MLVACEPGFKFHSQNVIEARAAVQPASSAIPEAVKPSVDALSLTARSTVGWEQM
jgi:hypothetical protein